MLLKRALIAVLVLVVAVFVYIGYSGYDAGRSAAVSAAGRARAGESQISVPPAEPPVTAPSSEPTVTPGKPAEGAASLGADNDTPKGAPAAPATDTIQPDPPNGMRFGGSGHYQLYRQGNLTWRLDTDTGDSCVLLATEEEWRKPQVYRAGCRKHE